MVLLLMLISTSFSSASYSTTITDQYGRTIQLKSHPMPDRYNKCHLCHLKKNKEFIRAKKTLTREHAEKSNAHGTVEISCNNCHDVNHSNYLRSTEHYKASFEFSSPVCHRCHSNQYRDWIKGTHGKRVGNWNGKRIQYNCIDCHDPHSVVFKSMESQSDPYHPKYLIQKDEHIEHER